MDRCDVTEILLKAALITIQSINQSISQSIPKRQISDSSKFKTSAYDRLNIAANEVKVSDRADNIVERGENM